MPNISRNLIKKLNVIPLTLGELVSKFVSFKQNIFGINDPNS